MRVDTKKSKYNSFVFVERDATPRCSPNRKREQNMFLSIIGALPVSETEILV